MMTQQQLESLSSTCIRELDAIVESKEQQLIATVFIITLIRAAITLPVSMFRKVPQILRIIANAIDVIISESKK